MTKSGLRARALSLTLITNPDDRGTIRMTLSGLRTHALSFTLLPPLMSGGLTP